MRAAAASRAGRQLLVAVAALVVIDRFEPALLRAVEETRYERREPDFRFENSDLFGLGPLITYLREHPRGELRRVLFFGNSITYGYLLNAADAVPAHYQRLDTTAKVFNVGINGFTSGSSFLVAKAAVQSVDLVYILRQGDKSAHPMLPKLIPIEDRDLSEFRLAAPNQAERLLSRAANQWRLYRDAYRLQAALWGTSTRQYVYLNKGRLARGLVAYLHAAQPSNAASDETVTLEAPMSGARPDARREGLRRETSPQLWQLGDLFATRQKQLFFLHIPGYSDPLSGDDIGDFNRVFSPYAQVLVLHIPMALTFDGQHLTSAGAAQVARALWQRPENHRR